MPRAIKVLLLFEMGIILAIFLFGQHTKPTLPVASVLGDLTFPSEAESPLSLIFTGDVMLGRSVNTRILKYSDPTWPFLKIGQVLSQADITIINLESPFVQGCLPTDSGMLFCADPQNVLGLKYAGVEYATLANNHINNFGEKGIKDTKSVLTANNIIPVEQGKTQFNTVKKTSIALLTFSDLPPVDDNFVKTQISLATSSADLTIVTFHWGNEYQSQPSNRQIELAHLAIDSGADLIVGHHPHWIQSRETYRDKPIFYSLGNLVFDQMWSEETRLGEIIKVTVSDKEIVDIQTIKIKINNYGQPSFIEE